MSESEEVSEELTELIQAGIEAALNEECGSEEKVEEMFSDC